MRPNATKRSAPSKDTSNEAARPIIIPPASLTADLIEPERPRGLVLIAYETRADWLRARNRREAERLAGAGFATLSFGLLHDAEAQSSRAVDIDLLAARFVDALHWAKRHARLGKLRVGLMAMDASVAAALRAAAVEPRSVQAIVSKNGRLDLAGSAAKDARAAVLLIVGSEDNHLLGQSVAALSKLATPRRMETVEAASSPFQELAALGSVTDLALDWFIEHLGQPASPEPDDEKPAVHQSVVDAMRSGVGAMPIKEDEAEVREAVGVFDEVEALQGAIDELLSSGFDRADLSLLASVHAVEEKLGDKSFRRVELEDNPATPRTEYVSPDAIGTAEGGLISGLMYLGAVATAGVIALSGGPVTAMVVGAAIAGGAGGLIGAGLAEVVGHKRARYFQRQLARGGLLLWVRTWTPNQEARATEILRRHSGRDVHVHGLPSVAAKSPTSR